LLRGTKRFDVPYKHTMSARRCRWLVLKFFQSPPALPANIAGLVLKTGKKCRPTMQAQANVAGLPNREEEQANHAMQRKWSLTVLIVTTAVVAACLWQRENTKTKNNNIEILHHGKLKSMNKKARDYPNQRSYPRDRSKVCLYIQRT